MIWKWQEIENKLDHGIISSDAEMKAAEKSITRMYVAGFFFAAYSQYSLQHGVV